MKPIKYLFVFLFLISSVSFSQFQRYEVHKRGMLHQAVYNTGELGRPLDNGATKAQLVQPSFEWPGNSSTWVDGVFYKGQHCSFGGGFYIAADTGQGTTKGRAYIQCGAAATSGGNSVTVENVYSFPVRLEKIQNFPVLANGELNSSYNPNEAEEIIISEWDTPIGITVTRTSRAWSHPDYDDFIIYEYKLENTGRKFRSDTLRALLVGFAYSFAPSMFAGERLNNGVWLEGSYRSDKPDIAKISVYARYDWKRYMIYNHTMDGVPDPKYFEFWAQTGKNGGGLIAPQAVGMLPLYYDYSKLAHRNVTTMNISPLADTAIVWDDHGKLKQPFNIRWDNSNLDLAKMRLNMNVEAGRYNTPFRGSTDSAEFGLYMRGRGKPNWTASLRNPTGKIYAFGPYTLLPGEIIHFVVAEVAGYGAGVASDSIYKDLGGGWGNNGTPVEPAPGTHPVPSWYNTMNYDYLNNLRPRDGMGSTYLQRYPLPDYVNSNVISVRDVADRAIQMYRGGPLIKYDTSQYEPTTFNPGNYPSVPSTAPAGVYRAPLIVPAPSIIIRNTSAGSNQVIWGKQVESFNLSGLLAPLSHYLVMRANSPIGPWSVLDSVGKRDSRYYTSISEIKGEASPLVLQDSAYIYLDRDSDVGAGYYYCVVTVDTLGNKSGKTNLTFHNTQAPAAEKLGKVYAAPNPFIVNSRSAGTSLVGDINNKIGFFGLPQRATIRIYTYSGQLVETIKHDANEFSTAWFQVSRNNQWVASGVYYFTVDDDKGNRAWNKFVIIH